jgi:hypothetical protein
MLELSLGFALRDNVSIVVGIVVMVMLMVMVMRGAQQHCCIRQQNAPSAAQGSCFSLHLTRIPKVCATCDV